MAIAARIPHALTLALAGAALVTGTSGFAQPSPMATDPAEAQRRYETRIAECNGSGMPAPARNACVRNAGLLLDRTLGGPPANTEIDTPDGRATVIAPSGSIAPRTGSDTVTSGDGRATIVVPADGIGMPR
jgi:hypothetical protein